MLPKYIMLRDNLSDFTNLLTACLILILGFGSHAYSQSTISNHLVTVSRHANVSISNSDVDGYLSDGSARLFSDDDGAPGTADVSCAVTILRSSSVVPFQNGGPATVNSKTDWDLINTEPTLYKVVTAINYCGKSGISFNGCAATPGRKIVLVRTSTDIAGTWVHEFGHATGLSHSADKGAIMYGTGITGRNRVTQSECSNFTSGPPSTLTESEAEVVEVEDPIDNDLDLKDYILSGFPHQVSWKVTNKYRGVDITPTHHMLFENRYHTAWADAATVLGIVGTQETISVLIRFLETEPNGGEIQSTRRAKNNALLALGYLANRFDGGEALMALRKYSSTEKWFDQGNWLGLTDLERTAVAQDLAEVALIGLAVSGQADALPAIQEAEGSLAASKGAQRNTSFLEELREMHKEITEIGLESYYSK